jgi:hypothetical protein
MDKKLEKGAKKMIILSLSPIPTKPTAGDKETVISNETQYVFFQTASNPV